MTVKNPQGVTDVLEKMLPVGSIIEWSPVSGSSVDLSTAAKVAAYYGFGTWEAYGSGRMLLGVSSGHGVGSTGNVSRFQSNGSTQNVEAVPPYRAVYIYRRTA